jgi:hypothetical protein
MRLPRNYSPARDSMVWEKTNPSISIHRKQLPGSASTQSRAGESASCPPESIPARRRRGSMRRRNTARNRRAAGSAAASARAGRRAPPRKNPPSSSSPAAGLQPICLSIYLPRTKGKGEEGGSKHESLLQAAQERVMWEERWRA